MRLIDAAADVILGSSCLGCGEPGALACPSCRSTLEHGHLVRWLPDSKLVVMAGTWYQGPAVNLVRAHKDAAAWGLAGLLAAVVAASAQDVRQLMTGAQRAPAVLVPVPSWPHRVRERGYDHTAAVARLAANRLDWARPRPLLRRVGHGRQQVELSREDRAANRGATLRAMPGTGVAILIDDIVTTGATVSEAATALRHAGWWVAGVAAVAVTPRRHRDHDRTLRDIG